MVLTGLGLGLTSAPATESILSVLTPAKAGVGSAVNDATREAGGTLGVAVLGSIFTSLFAHHLSTTAFRGLPTHAVSAAQNLVAVALGTVGHAPGGAAQSQLLDGVHSSFMTGSTPRAWSPPPSASPGQPAPCYHPAGPSKRRSRPRRWKPRFPPGQRQVLAHADLLAIAQDRRAWHGGD